MAQMTYEQWDTNWKYLKTSSEKGTRLDDALDSSAKLTALLNFVPDEWLARNLSEFMRAFMDTKGRPSCLALVLLSHRHLFEAFTQRFSEVQLVQALTYWKPLLPILNRLQIGTLISTLSKSITSSNTSGLTEWISQPSAFDNFLQYVANQYEPTDAFTLIERILDENSDVALTREAYMNIGRFIIHCKKPKTDTDVESLIKILCKSTSSGLPLIQHLAPLGYAVILDKRGSLFEALCYSDEQFERIYTAMSVVDSSTGLSGIDRIAPANNLSEFQNILPPVWLDKNRDRLMEDLTCPNQNGQGALAALIPMGNLSLKTLFKSRMKWNGYWEHLTAPLKDMAEINTLAILVCNMTNANENIATSGIEDFRDLLIFMPRQFFEKHSQDILDAFTETCVKGTRLTLLQQLSYTPQAFAYLFRLIDAQVVRLNTNIILPQLLYIRGVASPLPLALMATNPDAFSYIWKKLDPRVISDFWNLIIETLDAPKATATFIKSLTENVPKDETLSDLNLRISYNAYTHPPAFRVFLDTVPDSAWERLPKTVVRQCAQAVHACGPAELSHYQNVRLLIAVNDKLSLKERRAIFPLLWGRIAQISNESMKNHNDLITGSALNIANFVDAIPKTYRFNNLDITSFVKRMPVPDRVKSIHQLMRLLPYIEPKHLPSFFFFLTGCSTLPDGALSPLQTYIKDSPEKHLFEGFPSDLLEDDWAMICKIVLHAFVPLQASDKSRISKCMHLFSTMPLLVERDTNIIISVLQMNKMMLPMARYLPEALMTILSPEWIQNNPEKYLPLLRERDDERDTVLFALGRNLTHLKSALECLPSTWINKNPIIFFITMTMLNTSLENALFHAVAAHHEPLCHFDKDTLAAHWNIIWACYTNQSRNQSCSAITLMVSQSKDNIFLTNALCAFIDAIPPAWAEQNIHTFLNVFRSSTAGRPSHEDGLKKGTPAYKTYHAFVARYSEIHIHEHTPPVLVQRIHENPVATSHQPNPTNERRLSL